MSAPITQADREAALDGYHSFFENVPNEAWERAMLAGKHDDDEVVQAFAAHRIAAERETVEKIAAWLRDQDGYGEWYEVADALEQGDWRNG
jgi:hypothetical protein